MRRVRGERRGDEERNMEKCFFCLRGVEVWGLAFGFFGWEARHLRHGGEIMCLGKAGGIG